jgi:hypothetical protein
MTDERLAELRALISEGRLDTADPKVLVRGWLEMLEEIARLQRSRAWWKRRKS